VALTFVACEQSREPTSPGKQLESIEETIRVSHICGNKFLISNRNRFTVEVIWRIRSSDEHGVKVLPPATPEDPGFSETEIETKHHGTLELSLRGHRLKVLPNQTASCAAAPALSLLQSSGPPAQVGKWTAPFPLPIVAVHLNLLPNGKLFFFGHQPPQMWDRAANTFTPFPQPQWLYCAGHAFLPDGRLLVAGGHIENLRGLPDAKLFSHTTQSWSVAAPMARGRWYPTLTTLGGGTILAIGGRDQNAVTVHTPEVWNGTTWRALTGANRTIPYNYPRTFLAPNGRVFYAGELQETFYLNTSGTGSWTYVADRLYGRRDYGSAVMYEPGKILYVGGGRTTNTAEVIDLKQPSPKWEWTGSMAYPRRHLNATVLPDGTVLVTGGSSGTDINDETRPVYAAELWSPTAKKWTVLAGNSVVRVLHSTALLLPDGKVVLAGGGEAAGKTDHLDAELFSPPYLFNPDGTLAARPRISSAPATTYYNTSFTVQTPDAASIGKIAWVRLGSVTHAFDQNQRYVPLVFTRTSNGLVVTPPASQNTAPPGHYMLFLINIKGVPSVARIQRVRFPPRP